MTTKKIKEMLDACYQAKRIREMLPPLPQERGTVPAADYRKRRTYHENCSYLRKR